MLVAVEPAVPVSVNVYVFAVGGGGAGLEELPHAVIPATRHMAPTSISAFPVHLLRRKPRGATPNTIANMNGMLRK
jgi:hypothetical protein